MNGRALNEKAIEVSPSSSRVLDRASEILTPFPPSKNRPRPGDWTCPSCGFSNFQRRTACFRCSFPAAGSNPDPMAFGYGYGPPMMPPPHHMGHHGMGHGGHGHGHGRGSVVPFRAGDWKCGSETCNYHNFAKNVNCLRCGAPRSGAAVDSAFPSPMDPPSGFGMGPGSMASTPGPGPFATPGGFGSGAGFGQQFGGPGPSYGMPPPQMGGPPYTPMSSMTPSYGSNSMSHSAASFGHPATQAAFSGAGHNPQSHDNSGLYGNEGGNDPFAFLSSGLGGLSVNDDGQNRRNGNASSAKSPA